MKMKHLLAGKAPLRPVQFHRIHSMTEYWMDPDPPKPNSGDFTAKCRTRIAERQSSRRASLPNNHCAKPEDQKQGCCNNESYCSSERSPHDDARSDNERKKHCSHGS